MKGDVMETAGLEWFAEIGIIIFFVVFLLIIVRVAFMKKEKTDRAKQIPLEEDRIMTGDDEERSGGDAEAHA